MRAGARCYRDHRRTGRSSAPHAESDALTQYLREIGAYPLRSRLDEERLARRIRSGDQGALDDLVRSNLRFVVFIARKYQHRGLPLADLIDEGNLGLLRAARRFDPDQGVKFISYAVSWVRQAILQALAEQSHIVRIPVQRACALQRIGRRANVLLQERGREPTEGELTAELQLDPRTMARAIAVRRPDLSLDAPTRPGEYDRLLDYIADDMQPTPHERLVHKALTETLHRALSRLREREATILRLYFGLDGGEPMTLEQIGIVLGITRERVRQVKERAISRLRYVQEARELATFRT